MKMKFGVVIPSYGDHTSREAVLKVAEKADELGFFSIWVAERLIVPEPPNQPWSLINTSAYEPLTTLSFLAAVTERVKLGVGVLILPFRNPLVVARQVTTLDILSGGRLILGVGVGWMNEEFQASGVSMRERGVRTDEAIRLFRELWNKPRPSFKGRFTEFPLINFEPKPLQDRVPIWIGGNSEAALRRVAGLGDGWLPQGDTSMEAMRKKVKKIERYTENYGRTMSNITLSGNCPGLKGKSESTRAIKTILEDYMEMGVDHIITRFNYNTIPELTEAMKIFASEIISTF